MESWDIPSLDLEPRLPEILSSTPEARAIAFNLRTGEGLSDHEVHERAWVVVLSGEVEVNSATGDCCCSSPPGLAPAIPARDDVASEALRAPPRRQETCAEMNRAL